MKKTIYSGLKQRNVELTIVIISQRTDTRLNVNQQRKRKCPTVLSHAMRVIRLIDKLPIIIDKRTG